jgi:hypothetical protein
MGEWLFLFMRESHLLQTIIADECYEQSEICSFIVLQLVEYVVRGLR